MLTMHRTLRVLLKAAMVSIALLALLTTTYLICAWCFPEQVAIFNGYIVQAKVYVDNLFPREPPRAFLENDAVTP